MIKFSTAFAAAALALGTSVIPANAAVLTLLAGDQDSYGTDKPLGSTVSAGEVINAPLDAADGTAFDRWGLDTMVWSYAYTLGIEPIISISLAVATLDLEDAGAGDGLGGAPYDDLLFVDGINVPGAFDTNFVPDSTDQLTSALTFFDLTAFASQFTDGAVSFELDTRGGTLKDWIALDYAELTIETGISPVPVPAGLPLLALGLGGLVLLRRK